MEISKIKVKNVEYDIKDTYPTEIGIIEEKVYQEAEEQKTLSFGDMSLEKINADSVLTIGTFWITDYMSDMIGKKLNSVTIYATKEGGIITFRGNDTMPPDKSTSNTLELVNIAKTLNDSTSTFDIFKITATAGMQTYLLDGSDNRVTILKQSAIDSCPSSLGVCKEGTDTTSFKYNQGTLTNLGYIRFYHESLTVIGSAADLETARTSGLAISFKYGGTDKVEVGTKTLLQIKMNNNDTVSMELEQKQEEEKKLKGKKISILGDSISTFRGHIPNGYAPFYPAGDIINVENTWWYQLINENEMQLITNASWSGSTVTGDSTSETNAQAGCSNARINALSNGNENPDIIIIYIGINDFALTSHRQLGDYKADTAIPEEGNITVFSDAYGLMVKKVLKKYPKAQVFCCTLLETAHNSYDTGENAQFPTKNNNNVPLSDFNERIKLIANRLGAKTIDLHNCGINYWNLSQNTMDLLHPNTLGANLIKKEIKNELLKNLQ